MAQDNENKTVSLSIWQLKILLEATNYFLDGLEDDEEAVVFGVCSTLVFV